MKLIDREKALKIAEDYGTMHGTTIGRHSGIADAIHYELEKLPTIEAETVKHGKWEYRDDDDYDDYTPRCSICGAPDAISREDYEYRGGKIRDNDSNYCPNCGAKMEETDIIR